MRFVTIRYARVFDFPLDAAFAWLTDYQDDDPQRTTRIVKRRPVVERTKDKVVLDGTLEVLGRTLQGRAEVRLFPPDRWEAHFLRGKGVQGSVYRYHLIPEGPQRTRLEVEYCIGTRRLKTYLMLALGKRRMWREIDAMWDGFARSMERELRAQPAVR